MLLGHRFRRPLVDLGPGGCLGEGVTRRCRCPREEDIDTLRACHRVLWRGARAVALRGWERIRRPHQGVTAMVTVDAIVRISVRGYPRSLRCVKYNE